MFHQSPGDKEDHMTIEGQTIDGRKFKRGHVQKDESKQTVRDDLSTDVLTMG